MMSEPDLAGLKHAPVPPPRDAAKLAALEAALAAFDASDAASTEKSEIETQALVKPVRPRDAQRDAPSRTEGKRTMRVSRFNYGLAASIAALMIAAPAAFLVYRQNTPGGGGLDNVPDRLANGPAEIAAVPPRSEMPATLPSPAPAPMQMAAAPALEEKAGQGAVSASGARSHAESMFAREPAKIATAKAKNRADRRLSKLSQDSRIIEGAGANVETRGNLAVAVGSSERSVVDAIAPAPPPDGYIVPSEKAFRDKFDAKDINPVKLVAQEPVSTFSIDVDTASYAFARRMINAGQLPPKDAVRVEEFINYFPYNYSEPDSAETPFKPTITVTPSPWNARDRLVHVAIQGYSLQSAQRPRANLVFLVDVSGSMAPDDRLPLAKNAFRLLIEELKPDDTVAIVTYASGSGVALEPTKISDKGKIFAAIDALGAGGSTAGAEGIQDAYRLAETHFDKSGVNRVILATDGDFNVGVTDQSELKGLIERKRDKGIFLSILGVGQGNYNDALMQTLAQNGNGTAAYVDNLSEARKTLVEEASSTLFPIAKDVKIQVEWNPARVFGYRLIGYETRALKREDFNNDKVDAGDVGSGHRVTAIYEITPAGSEKRVVDDLRYGKQKTETAATPAAADGELGFLKLRYKLPKEDASKLMTQPITEALAVESVSKAPDDVRFSISVAAFGQLLKGAPYLGKYNYDDVVALAQNAKGDDPFGYRAEFVNLARLAKSARP